MRLILAGFLTWGLFVGMESAPPSVVGQTNGVNSVEPAKDHLDRLQNYRTRILDPQARPDERRNWAEELVRESLRVQSAVSKAMVIELLELSANPDAQRAVCEAIPSASSGNQDRLDDGMVAPLLELLGSSNAELRSAAARALAEFTGAGVPTRLADIARSLDAPMIKRLAAIDSLAPNVYRRGVVEQLMGLMDADQPEIVSRVFVVLDPASRVVLGNDPSRWKAWWREQSQLSDEAWLTDQVRLYRDRVRNLKVEYEASRDRYKRHISDVSTRLRDFQREIFRTLAPEQREMRLVEWLLDPQDEVKLTAMAILKGRIADEGRRPEGEVLTTLLRLQKEGSPPVRREVLSILGNLGDTTVIKSVLAQVDEEKDPQTREALFRALGKLNAVEAVPVLVREIGSQNTTSECAREAAIALGRIAGQLGHRERLREAVEPLKARYQAAAPNDAALRAGLLNAMAGIGDPSFSVEFLEGVESDDAGLLRPAIQGLQAIGDSSKLSRLRRCTSHSEPLVRLAAIDAVGALGREDADLECILVRLNPSVESNEPAREAAWRAFCEMLRSKPARERLRAAAMLRDVPDREVEYLAELVAFLAAGKNNEIDLELARDRLSNQLLTQGKFSEAIPYLREIYTRNNKRGDPARVDAGLRLLDATLRSPGYSNAPGLVIQLAENAGQDEYIITRIVETVAQYLDSPETVGDPVRSRAVLDELKEVPSEGLGASWQKLLLRVASRLEKAEPGNGASPDARP